jgi:nicotinamide-nucleotide amidase
MYDEIFNTQDMIKFQDILKTNKQTITVAESCTGGLIASMITEISGSSEIFKGSIITYSNEIKEQELNVKKETIIKYGVVSSQVVAEMLNEVIKKFNADFAIAVSGIASPNESIDSKPVGTVVIGVINSYGRKTIQVCHFKGKRKEVQLQAAKRALKLNFGILVKKP